MPPRGGAAKAQPPSLYDIATTASSAQEAVNTLSAFNEETRLLAFEPAAAAPIGAQAGNIGASVRARLAELPWADEWDMRFRNDVAKEVVKLRVGMTYHAIESVHFPDETFYTNGYYASAGTYISAKAAEFMSKLDMLILIAALLRIDPGALICVPGVALVKALAAIFSTYAPLTDGKLADQKTGNLFATFTDLFGRVVAATWLETHRSFALINKAAIKLGLLPKNLPALLIDSVNVMPVATRLYDGAGARVSGAVTSWVADMRRRSEAGEPTASLVLCIWGAILSMIILGIFEASGIAPGRRADAAGVLIIVQTSDARDALQQLQDLGVLVVDGFRVENVAVVVAPEVTGPGYSPANMVGTRGQLLLATQHAYVRLFDFLRKRWITFSPLAPGVRLPKQLTHELISRVMMDLDAPLHTAEGLLAHNSNMGAVGMAIALQARAALRAKPNMDVAEMTQFLHDHGVDPLVPTAPAVERGLGARALEEDDDEDDDEYSSEEEEEEEEEGSEGDDSDYM